MLWLPTERVRFEIGERCDHPGCRDDNGSPGCRRANDLVKVRPFGGTSIRIDAGATAYRVGGSRFIESLLALVNVFATSGAPAAKPVSAVVATLEPAHSSGARGLLILWNRSSIESLTSSANEVES